MIEEREEREVRRDTSRIDAFSDGVFAIAITLLVLGLHVPLLRQTSSPDLWRALGREWPAYIAFVTSFATILIMWMNHHAIFRLIRRSDTQLALANGLLLMVVTAVPFPTMLVAEYLTTPAATAATAVYSGVFVLIAVAYDILWWSARRLLLPDVSAEHIRTITRNYLPGVPLYLTATLAAFVSPYLSIGICFALWVFWAFTAGEDGFQPFRRRSHASD